MNAQWYILREQENYGPYTDEQVQQFIREGRILPDDLAWCHGMAGWQALRQIPLFASQPTARAAEEESFRPVAGAEKKKRGRGASLLAGALGLLVLVTLSVAGYNYFFTTGEAAGNVAEAVTCRDVTEDSRPIDKSDIFSAADGEIFLTAVVEGAGRGSILEAVWYYSPGPEEKDSALVMYAEELNRGDSRVHFSLNQPGIGWEKGRYAVDLIIDGRVKNTAYFEIN